MKRGLIAGLAALALAWTSGAACQPAGEIVNPDWQSQPTPRQATDAYPLSAMVNEKIGVAVVRCIAAASGQLTDCSLVCEAPERWRFGPAALKLASYYRLRPTLPDGGSVEGRTVTLPFFFNPPFLERAPRCDGRPSK